MTTPLPTGWEADILNALGAPVTPNNVGNLDIWQRVEGGSTNNREAYNPFNTKLPQPGSINEGSGLQAYPDWATGLHATVATLEQSNMKVVSDALRGNFATPQFEAALIQSPWDQGHYANGFPGAVPSPGGGSRGTVDISNAQPTSFDPSSLIPVIGGPVGAAVAGGPSLVGNILGDFLKSVISNGYVLRGTLMVSGLIILFIGLSQLSKGEQTAGQTASGGVQTVAVHVGRAKSRVGEGVAA